MPNRPKPVCTVSVERKRTQTAHYGRKLRDAGGYERLSMAPGTVRGDRSHAHP